MARIICAYSGLDIRVEHFPLYASASESCHPIFEFSSAKLIPFYESLYLEEKLTPDEKYLYYLALLKSSGFVDFRNPGIRTSHTQSIITNTIHDLVQMVQRIQLIGEERCISVLDIPRFIITIETRDLSCCKDWLRVWQDNYADYQQGYRTTTAIEKITRLESALERNIKNKLKDISSYASQLANWAEAAGNFPAYEVADENDLACPANEYWKRIIRWCATEDRMYRINSYDLADLTEFCEENIDHGNIQAHTLMSLLRSATSKKYAISSLGVIDINSTKTYKILKASDGVEEANMLALILSAPLSEPRESQYPNKLAYVRARMSWNTACEYYKEHPEEKPGYTADSGEEKLS